MSDDNFFTALGPNELYGYGFATSGAQIIYGGLLEGLIVGSFGASTEAPPVFNEALPISRVGVWGEGDSVGVYGMTAAAGPNSGFNGEPRLAGVFGTSDTQPGVAGTSFRSCGVYGQNGDAGPEPVAAGVCGVSQNNVGVSGRSSEWIGVFGQAERNVGVLGMSTSSWGVSALSGTAASQQMEHAALLATSAQRTAVAAASNTAVAIHAHSGPAHNFGTFKTGTVTATSSGNGYGVSALSLKFDAVHGVSVGSHGVTGYSSANYGVYGLSFAPPAANTTPPQVPAGVYGQSFGGAFGVLGVATRTGAGVTGTGSGDGIGVFGYHPNGVAGYFDGNLFVTGQIFAGIKDAIVPFPDGSQRVLHCVESPEHWFEDFGSARLKRGRATVTLDADFAKVVTVNGYRVFLTPEGDCKGLYVRSKRGASFEVRELQGGTSSVAFSYRIVAKRKDIKRHTRFAKIDAPVVPLHAGKARAGRGRKPARLPAAMRAMFGTLEKEARRKAT
jgi:hypothetical protein